MIRPILFSGDMVRAILDGQKTETRRPVKPCKDVNFGCELSPGEIAGEVNQGNDYQNCPYGRPGDLLWVRETWAHHPCGGTLRLPPGEGHAWGNPIYRATFGAGIKPVCEGFTPWRPSIHMPRWACRLVLEVLTVRVERLQDITEEGAKAEGFESRAAFLSAYLAMYKLVPYANPWVWVVGFKTAAVGNEAAQAVMRAAA